MRTIKEIRAEGQEIVEKMRDATGAERGALLVRLTEINQEIETVRGKRRTEVDPLAGNEDLRGMSVDDLNTAEARARYIIKRATYGHTTNDGKARVAAEAAAAKVRLRAIRIARSRTLAAAASAATRALPSLVACP